MLGTVDSPSGRQLTVADVPGLIEGASEGVGLGHEFLAHLERARLLVHVIDAAEGDAADRFSLIDSELSAYGAGLDRLPQIVVLNKVDVAGEVSFELEDDRVLRVIRASAITGAGIDELVNALFELCPPAPEPPRRTTTAWSSSSSTGRAPTHAAAFGFCARTEASVTGSAPEPDELEAALRAAARRPAPRSRSTARP